MAEFSTVSSELDLLLRTCRSQASFDAFDMEVVDWNRFCRLAIRHKLGALAYQRFVNAPARMAGPGHFAWKNLEPGYRETVLRNLAQEADTLELVQLLDSVDIRVLPFKGIAAGQLLHGDEYQLRFSSDIDVLVSDSDIEQVDALLRNSGYVRRWPNLGSLPRTHPMLLLLTSAFEYESPKFGSTIEVHHRLTHNPFWLDIDFDLLCERSEEVSFTNGVVRTLGADDLACYMCCHMIDHHRLRLKWIDDAYRALARTAYIKMKKPSSAMPGLKARNAVNRAAAIAANLFGETLNGCNPAILRELDNFQSESERRELGTLLLECKHVWDRTKLGGSWRATWHDVLRMLSDPRDILSLRLNHRWQLVYALVGPFLAVGRYAGRQFQV